MASTNTLFQVYTLHANVIAAFISKKLYDKILKHQFMDSTNSLFQAYTLLTFFNYQSCSISTNENKNTNILCSNDNVLKLRVGGWHTMWG